MGKLKTQEQLDRATDARLRKVYGISLVEYNAMLEAQGNGCAICSRPPKTLRLNVDHDHASHKIKISSSRASPKSLWVVRATYNGKDYVCNSTKKSDANQAVRKAIRRASVRGLTCWHCNKGIEKFDDSPKRLRAAAEYLERFHYVQAV